MISCEFCKNFKNIFFVENLQAAASEGFRSIFKAF